MVPNTPIIRKYINDLLQCTDSYFRTHAYGDYDLRKGGKKVMNENISIHVFFQDKSQSYSLGILHSTQ